MNLSVGLCPVCGYIVPDCTCTSGEPFPADTRVKLRDPDSLPHIGTAEGRVTGRMVASGRLRVVFPTVVYYRREMFAVLRDSEVERVE